MKMLERARPESADVAHERILTFMHRLEEEKLCMHGFLMVRSGRTIAEGHWKPFYVKIQHRLDSSTKSFVSIAIGILIGENKLRLEDKVMSFFPDVEKGTAYIRM